MRQVTEKGENHGLRGPSICWEPGRVSQWHRVRRRLWHLRSHHVSFTFQSLQDEVRLAVELMRELQRWGFRFEVVLVDSLYGESGDCIAELETLHLKYVVAIRSNHGVRLPPGQRVQYTN